MCYCEYEFLSEVISYGFSNALDIVMQLVIDEDNAQKQNRKALLKDYYNKAGISIAKHRLYNYVCVIDLGKIEIELDSNQFNANKNKTFSLQEQELLELINFVRTNPKEFAKKYVEKIKDKSADNLECYNELMNMKAVDKLIVSPALRNSAKKHVEDIGSKGLSGHDSSNGILFGDRIKSYCNCYYTMIGENIDYGSSNPIEILLTLLIDEGITDRGHRKNILEKDFKYIGLSIGYHASYQSMCVMDFADKVEPK